MAKEKKKPGRKPGVKIGKVGPQKNPHWVKGNCPPASIKKGEICLNATMLEKLREVANPNNDPPEVLFVGALSSGVPIEIACERCGISSETWRQWIRRADAGEDIPFLAEFRQLAKMVEANFLAYNMASLVKISSGEQKGWWQGHAWVLERMRQDIFALKKEATKNEVTINMPSSISKEAEQAAQAYLKIKKEQPIIDVESRPLQLENDKDLEDSEVVEDE